MTIGIVSGYFNPIHPGHIEYINGAKKHCDFLYAIVNNDKQIVMKRSTPFMDENQRWMILSNIKNVDEALVAQDGNPSVCKTIEFIRSMRPDDEMIFFNSGDRTGVNVNQEEVILCEQLHIKYIVITLPKRFSSTELLKEAAIKMIRKS